MKRSLHILILLVFAGFLALSVSAEELKHLVILHTNDIHGAISEQDAFFLNPDFPPPVGGASTVQYIREVRKECAQKGWGFLLVDDGDIYQGTPVGDVTQGAAIVRFFNYIGYDCWNLGNHDFDDGVENARRLCELSEMPVLSANTVDAETDEVVPWVDPYIIREISGVKIGLVGVNTTDMPSLVPADKLKGVKFLPVAHTLDRYARLLRDEKRCDIIIALTHIGFSHQMDLERHTERLNGWLAEAEELGLKPFSPELWEFVRERKGYGLSDLEISRIVPGIDVIIGGHSHVGIQPPYEDPFTHTIVVQAYSRFTCVGRMDLFIDPETRAIQSYDHELVTIFGEEYVEDPEAKEWLAHEVGRVEKELSAPISYAKSVITRGDYETTLGNLITDAMCEETGADVALINRGGIRADIPAGDVTELVVYKVLPFGNTVVTIPVTGRELWEVLEAGVSGRRRDTQLSGVRILWNPTLPSGQRICSIEVNGEPLDPDGMYILATSDYLASGAIGYTVLERLSQDAYFGGITIREALVRYLKKRKEVDPQIEGRNIRAENAKMSPLMERLNREAEEAQKAEEAAGTAPPSYYTK